MESIVKQMTDTHRVKSWLYLYEAAVSGKKKHDFRFKDERDYKVGDTLVLCEYDQATGGYTGRETEFVITYITSNETPCAISSNGLNREVCVLSIERK